jgi:hypothetical protein
MLNLFIQYAITMFFGVMCVWIVYLLAKDTFRW